MMSKEIKLEKINHHVDTAPVCKYPLCTIVSSTGQQRAIPLLLALLELPLVKASLPEFAMFLPSSAVHLTLPYDDKTVDNLIIFLKTGSVTVNKSESEEIRTILRDLMVVGDINFKTQVYIVHGTQKGVFPKTLKIIGL